MEICEDPFEKRLDQLDDLLVEALAPKVYEWLQSNFHKLGNRKPIPNGTAADYLEIAPDQVYDMMIVIILQFNACVIRS